jgi:hypothetical protein
MEMLSRSAAILVRQCFAAGWINWRQLTEQVRHLVAMAGLSCWHTLTLVLLVGENWMESSVRRVKTGRLLSGRVRTVRFWPIGHDCGHQADGHCDDR